jgi:hypothetical protein
MANDINTKSQPPPAEPEIAEQMTTLVQWVSINIDLCTTLAERLAPVRRPDPRPDYSDPGTKESLMSPLAAVIREQGRQLKRNAEFLHCLLSELEV